MNEKESSRFIEIVFFDKRITLIKHVFLIFLLASNFQILDIGYLKNLSNTTHVPFRNIVLNELFDFTVSTAAIYLQLIFLNPRYLFTNRFKIYFIWQFFIVVIVYCIVRLSQYFLIETYSKNSLFFIESGFFGFIETIIYPMVFIVAIASYGLFKRGILQQRKMMELEKLKIAAELNQLKTQINPHFLFNTLNNLHQLAVVNHEKTSEIILGLSDVLRYQIYDSQKELVQISSDIEAIEKYLLIEKIRRDNFDIKIESKNISAEYLIPPLLFVNFIDNAVKHSLGSESSYIFVQFEFQDDHLMFTCKNSKPKFISSQLQGGLGLENSKRRLELLYKNQFDLKILENATEFEVKLKLPKN
jgi:sensor histidine kinase YesM